MYLITFDCSFIIIFSVIPFNDCEIMIYIRLIDKTYFTIMYTSQYYLIYYYLYII